MTMFTIYDEVLMILMGKKTRSLSSRQDIKAVNLQHPDPNDRNDRNDPDRSLPVGRRPVTSKRNRFTLW